MSSLTKRFTNKPLKGAEISSIVTLLKRQEADNLFIRVDYPEEDGEDPNLIWLSSEVALEIAEWILDNVEEVEE